ncbi:MAG: DUF4328 domain-containing protein [Bacteroidetes bacterium]|nr:MAG: DUF4328 domain-containing protein [Bacteroidota bacterium]
MNPVKSNKILAKILISSFIGLLVTVIIITIWESFKSDDLLNSYSRNETYEAFIVIRILLYFITSIIFIIWFYRAYKNLENIDTPLQYKKSWAIGGWFIPIISFFYPKVIMNEIWTNTQVSSDQNYIKPTTYVTIWWSLFLISNILPIILMRFSNSFSISEYLTYNLFSNLLTMIAISSTIYLVKTLSGFETYLFNKYEKFVNSDEFQELIKEKDNI